MVVFAGLAAILTAAVCAATVGTDEHGTLVALRATAVLAFPYLLGAYAAPAVSALFPGPLAERLLAARRRLGLSFAAVFAVHLAEIFRLFSLSPEPPPAPSAVIVGGLGYVFIGALVLTSFEGPAAALGESRVRLVRTIGEQWVFAVFTLTLLNASINQSRLWIPLLALSVATYLARLAARYRRWAAVKRPVGA